jgi:hypothetical protein
MLRAHQILFQWKRFLVCGVAPVVALCGIAWIYRGFKKAKGK